MSVTNKEILDLYDQANTRAKAGLPQGWGVNVRVKIVEGEKEMEVETHQVAPPAAKGAYQQAKAVKLEDLKKALRGYENMIEVKEQGDEIIITPLQRLGKDWGTIDMAIKDLNGGVRAWKSDPDPMKSKWVVRKA